MKKFIKVFSIFTLVALAAVSFAACGKKVTTETYVFSKTIAEETVTSSFKSTLDFISINESTKKIEIGKLSQRGTGFIEFYSYKMSNGKYVVNDVNPGIFGVLASTTKLTIEKTDNILSVNRKTSNSFGPFSNASNHNLKFEFSDAEQVYMLTEAKTVATTASAEIGIKSNGTYKLVMKMYDFDLLLSSGSYIKTADTIKLKEGEDIVFDGQLVEDNIVAEIIGNLKSSSIFSSVTGEITFVKK